MLLGSETFFFFCVGNSLHCDMISVKMGMRKLKQFCITVHLFYVLRETQVRRAIFLCVPQVSQEQLKKLWVSCCCINHLFLSSKLKRRYWQPGLLCGLDCVTLILSTCFFCFSDGNLLSSQGARGKAFGQLDCSDYLLSLFKVILEFLQICLDISLCLHAQQ